MIYLTVIITRKDDFKLRRESVRTLSVNTENTKYSFILTYLNGQSETVCVEKNDFLNISVISHTLDK